MRTYSADYTIILHAKYVHYKYYSENDFTIVERIHLKRVKVSCGTAQLHIQSQYVFFLRSLNLI
jgi:hypothetical protein